MMALQVPGSGRDRQMRNPGRNGVAAATAGFPPASHSWDTGCCAGATRRVGNSFVTGRWSFYHAEFQRDKRFKQLLARRMFIEFQDPGTIRGNRHSNPRHRFAMNLSLRQLVSAAAAAGLVGFTIFSAIENGLCSHPVVCGFALLAVYGVIELTVLSYANTPGTRACVMRAMPGGRSSARSEFHMAAGRRRVARHPVLAA
jgi:hypothetical protein